MTTSGYGGGGVPSHSPGGPSASAGSLIPTISLSPVYSSVGMTNEELVKIVAMQNAVTCGVCIGNDRFVTNNVEGVEGVEIGIGADDVKVSRAFISCCFDFYEYFVR